MTGERWERTVEVAGRTRRYLVHVPRDAVCSAEDPWPAVLAFHGGGSTAEAMVEFSGLAEKADQAGFLAIFPSGTGRVSSALTWNGGNCCGRAMKDNVDDMGFVRMLLDDLAAWIPLDRTRVYATGMSNGGMLAYRLAAELADQIAAVAPVGGPIGCLSPTPRVPVPICHFHGTLDEFAPFAGGIGKRSLSKTRFHSVEQSIAIWVQLNGCHPVPQVEELPARVDDGTHVTQTRYVGGAAGAEVRLYTIHGGGHTWPGRRTTLSQLGPTTDNLQANDVMWDFFQQYRRTVVAEPTREQQGQ